MFKSFMALVAFFSIAAQAQTYDYAKKIGVGGGYGREFPLMDTGPIEGKTSKSSDAYNLHGRYHLNSAGAIVFSLTRSDLPATKVMQDVYELTYIHRLQPVERFSWVLGAGAGLLDYTKVSGNDNWWRVTGKIRAGAEYSICPSLIAAFNVDLSYFNNTLNPSDGKSSNHNQMNLTPHVNLTWFFGCGEACEKKETPKAAPVMKPVAPVDGDMDKDGVRDSKDKCPSSPAGAKVNAYGCVAAEKAHIEVEIMFASGSAAIADSANAQLSELAAFLNEHPKTKAEIQGHTDSSGNPASNKVLSQKRADAVKNYLINVLKIDGARLESTGYGADKPVATNATAEGRTENRRVMAVIEE